MLRRFSVKTGKKNAGETGEGVKISKNLNTRVRKMQDMLKLKDIAQKRYRIYNLQRQINNNFKKIGELTYRQKLGDKEKEVQAEIDEIFEETKGLESEVESLRNQIKEIQTGTLTCPNCENVLPQDGIYCSYCGYDLVTQRKRRLNILNRAAQKKEEAEELVCPDCEETVPAGGVFCCYCGNKVTGLKSRNNKFSSLVRRKSSKTE